jgi:protein TonB
MRGKQVRLFILLGVVALHLVLILTITISIGQKERRADTSIFKVVDLQEYVPPPPEPEPEKKPIEPEMKIEVAPQESLAEEIIETDKEVVEVETAAAPRTEPAPAPRIDYLPQHKISVRPEMPEKEILKRIEYPPLANRQRIEGVVFLELFIDKNGRIRNIVVLKDPGYGFAEAAIEALEGMTVKPAEANGVPVAVRYRYPIRFKLKQ